MSDLELTLVLVFIGWLLLGGGDVKMLGELALDFVIGLAILAVLAYAFS